MNIQTIQEKLNSEFKGKERKRIFWFDDNGDFSEEIGTLTIENAKIHRLEKDNFLYTKYFLECIDQEINYLIYADFSRPDDRENHLADMIYYSKQFFADRISLLCADLNIPDKFKEQLGSYKDFWRSNARIEKFIALGIENYDSETIEIGVLSVIVGVRTPNFEEVLKTIIIAGEYEENKHIAELKKRSLDQSFWKLCEKYYGYTDEAPTIEKLVIMLMITYVDFQFKGELPKSWQGYISHKKNDIAIFLSNLMNNILYKDQFDEIAKGIAQKIKANEFFERIPANEYFTCDIFELFDRGIIKHFAAILISNTEPLTEAYREVIKKRTSKMHFAVQYKDHYETIESVDKLIGAIQEFKDDSIKNTEEAISLYTTKWAYIDKAYRDFYTTFDKIEADDYFYKLRELVENLYTNEYLMKLSVMWAEKLELIEKLSLLKGSKQYEFYQNHIENHIKKECTVVIISDAFRYECGIELTQRLREKAGTNVELDYMVAAIPSYTRLGMVSLLPHKSIKFSDGYEVLLDNEAVNAMSLREKILKRHVTESVMKGLNELMSMKRDEIRSLLTGKELIYVYHDQIDARGDNPATENEVFAAAHESMQEIINLIQKLTVDKTITNYIITADHGFIYKRDKLAESDKVNLGKQADSYVNKRFILSKERLQIEGSLCYDLGYLSDEARDTYATVPRGADIFKVPGGGQNYVHGGVSLQEIIIPLVKVKTERAKKEVGSVEIVLTSLVRKITNLITFFDFIQTENVSDILKASTLKVYFESESGEIISNEELIVADHKNASPGKRMFHEKFTFKNRKYSKEEKYFMVIKDAKTNVEFARHEFIIDIAFADDFGFGV